MKKVKRDFMEFKNIFTCHIFDKGLVSALYKCLIVQPKPAN
jgi:hypothetical protein